MLKPTWYLTDIDWFAQLPGAPRLDVDDEAVIGQLAALFHGESHVDPATTVAATHVILLGVEHLSDTMTSAAQTHDLTELARLLCGFNLIQAHLTQTVQRVAEYVNGRTFTGLLANAPAAAIQPFTESLGAAGDRAVRR